MLIGLEQDAFDDPNYIYEVKLDGIRCLVYIDDQGIQLRNKRNMKLNERFPELLQMHKHIKKACVLDGELSVVKQGRTDFFAVQKRTMLRDTTKIRYESQVRPALFTAFDCLYTEQRCLLQTPLYERKAIVKTLLAGQDDIAMANYIAQKGRSLFAMTTQQGVEGIVAKHKDSRYACGKRTKEWIKCKNMLEDDYVVVGYIRKEKQIVSLVLGQYEDMQLRYMGHVSMGVSLPELLAHAQPTNQPPFSQHLANHEAAVWIKPVLVATIRFMMYTKTGGLRQPVFRGFRNDKVPRECVVMQQGKRRV